MASCSLSGQISMLNCEIEAGDAVVANTTATGSVIITNRGTLGGHFTLNPGATIGIKNYGTLEAGFTLASGAELWYYIYSANGIRRLDVSGGGAYIPIIAKEFTGRVSASALLSAFDGTIRVEAAVLVIDAFDNAERERLAARLDIAESVRFNILSSAGVAGRLFGYYMDADGTRRIREKDYAVILEKNDKRAGFLNAVRAQNPNNKTIAKLDRAETMTGLYSIMDKSMFFNPLVLNRRLGRMFAPDSNLDAAPGFHVGGRAGLDNIGFNLGFRDARFSVETGFHFGLIQEDDEYKQGRAAVYGISADASCGAFGFGGKIIAADWRDVIVMSEDGEIDASATSRFFHGFLDYRPAFENIQPILRVNYATSEIATARETKVYPSAGLRVHFSDEAAGAKNRFGAFVMASLPGQSLTGVFDVGLFAESHFARDDMTIGVRLSPFDSNIVFRMGF